MGAGGIPDQGQLDETDGIRVFDEWTEDEDLSLDPETGRVAKKPARPTARGLSHKEIPIHSISVDSTVLIAPPPRASGGGRWLLGFGLGFALLALVLGTGGLLAVLAAGAAMGGAFVLFVPAVDVVLPPPPAPEPVVVEAPAAPAPQPAEVRPARASGEARIGGRRPRKIEPAPAPPPEVPPAGGEVEAELVVMPDPGFRSKPLDKAIEQLNAKGESGQIGVVAGH